MPEGETVEVWERVWVGQQGVELVVDFRRAIDAEDDAADGNHDHHDVQDVPEGLEVRQTYLLDLQSTNHTIESLMLVGFYFCFFFH